MYEIVKKVFEGESPKSIFEVGCAGGALLKDYYDFRQIEVGGMDINAEDIKKAKKVFPEYAENFIIHDATQKWPIKKKYDICFTIGTLTLIENPISVIEEMLRIGRKIILAESHSEREKTEDVGNTRTGYRYRFIRDYEKIFKELNLKPTYSIYLDKTIIKCQKTTNLQ